MRRSAKPTMRQRAGAEGLPFVAPDVSSWWWQVEPTGDWHADNQTGMRYARALLECMAARDCAGAGQSLGSVARDMGGNVDGVTVGFWSYIEIAAVGGMNDARQQAAWWDAKWEALPDRIRATLSPSRARSGAP